MADEFNIDEARSNHYRLMDKLVWAKNRILKCTDYYYDYPPQDTDHKQEVTRSMREAAMEARQELDKVINEIY